jgi:hypothetical protein
LRYASAWFHFAGELPDQCRRCGVHLYGRLESGEFLVRYQQQRPHLIVRRCGEGTHVISNEPRRPISARCGDEVCRIDAAAPPDVPGYATGCTPRA